MNRYTYVPGPKAHLVEDMEGEWVKWDDLVGASNITADEVDSLIKLCSELADLADKFREAYENQKEITRQVWREHGEAMQLLIEKQQLKGKQ